MAVYFIKAVPSGNIKIGYSLNPQSRMAQLQTGSFERLELLGWIHGDMALEQEIHAKLAQFRMNGTEWFLNCAEVNAEIAARMTKTRPPRIYFAGKVRPGSSDYRTRLFSRLGSGQDSGPMVGSSKRYKLRMLNGCDFEIDYVGPFAIRNLEFAGDIICDEHGPGFTHLDRFDEIHGPNTHGCGLVAATNELSEKFNSSTKGDIGGIGDQTRRLLVETTDEHGYPSQFGRDVLVARCLEQIRFADRIHAFIDSFDCYGTIFELGYAAALGKPTWIHVDSRLAGRIEALCGELWFAMNAPKVTVVSDDPYSFSMDEAEPVEASAQ